jgi:hypothetical protein
MDFYSLIRQNSIKGKAIPVLNEASYHEEAWKVEVQLHVFLISETPG